MPPVRPRADIFCTRGEYVTMSNGVFKITHTKYDTKSHISTHIHTVKQ